MRFTLYQPETLAVLVSDLLLVGLATFAVLMALGVLGLWVVSFFGLDPRDDQEGSGDE